MHSLEIQALKPDQWESFKSLRLAALKHDPSSFGKTYAEESELSNEEWKRKAMESNSKNDRDTLIAYLDESPVGLIFVFIREDSNTGAIGGFWVNPNFRRKGIGKALIQSSMDWLNSKKIKEMNFWNNPNNAASSAFYQKMGFSYIGKKQSLESDPTQKIQLMRKELN